MPTTMYRTALDEYAPRYADFLRFRREGGVLEARLHTDGGPLRWGPAAHRALVPAMADINNDPENECLILTGTGEEFLGGIDMDAWRSAGLDTEFGAHQSYDLFYYDQTREPLGFVELKIPVIAAVNGPSVVHGELALLHDIVICSENTYFSDTHWAGLGIVPGDGVHTLFRKLLGPNRGRYFLLTGQQLSAKQALDLGLVAEVVAREKLVERAWEIARTVFMSKDRSQRRLTRSLLIQPWRELFAKELPLGLAHECMACHCHWPLSQPDSEVQRSSVG